MQTLSRSSEYLAANLVAAKIAQECAIVKVGPHAATTATSTRKANAKQRRTQIKVWPNSWGIAVVCCRAQLHTHTEGTELHSCDAESQSIMSVCSEIERSQNGVTDRTILMIFRFTNTKLPERMPNWLAQNAAICIRCVTAANGLFLLGQFRLVICTKSKSNQSSISTRVEQIEPNPNAMRKKMIVSI